jgi:hypothetical protein
VKIDKVINAECINNQSEWPIVGLQLSTRSASESGPSSRGPWFARILGAEIAFASNLKSSKSELTLLETAVHALGSSP